MWSRFGLSEARSTIKMKVDVFKKRIFFFKKKKIYIYIYTYLLTYIHFTLQYCSTLFFHKDSSLGHHAHPSPFTICVGSQGHIYFVAFDIIHIFISRALQEDNYLRDRI